MTHRKPSRDCRARPARGFTLVELLVVVLIVLMVSAIALPTVISAISHRQIGEAARLLQASLVGARDAAIHSNAPRGIRLLPDPAYFTQTTDPRTGAQIAPILPRLNNNPNSQIAPTAILAANRFIPIEAAPDYTEGLLDTYVPAPPAGGPGHVWIGGKTPGWAGGFPPPFPRSYGNAPAPFNQCWPINFTGVGATSWMGVSGKPVILPVVLCVTESALDPTTLLAHPPTSWFWNVRVGDRLTIGDSGMYYTVIGPEVIANPEHFVNDGNPGTVSGLTRVYSSGAEIPVQYLFLVNGNDDNLDGFVDNGWDGIDNDNDGTVDGVEEMETERFRQTYTAGHNTSLSYRIRRRPVPSSGSREVALPSTVVVDLTTLMPNRATGVAPMERSRLPIDPFTGYVDILMNPGGDVVPTTLYSSPASLGLAGAFYHFWLAERQDVYAPQGDAKGNLTPLVSGRGFYLPMPAFAAYDTLVTANPALPVLKGERRLVTLNTRTGQVLTNSLEDTSFDITNTNLPYLLPQQGAQGEQ